jgi:hypothetical protein
LRWKVIPKRMPSENIFESFHRYFASSSFQLGPQDRRSSLRELADTSRLLPITLWLQQLLGVGGARHVIMAAGANGSVVNPRTLLTMADWLFTVFQRPNLHRSPVVRLGGIETN